MIMARPEAMIAVAFVCLISLSFPIVELSAGEVRAAPGFGRSKPSHFAGSLRQSGGFHGSRGVRTESRGRHFHPHRFGSQKHKRFFAPHYHLGRRHVILFRHHGLHHRYFFGHGVSVPHSSVIIWSHPGVLPGLAVPQPESVIDAVTPPERPLISILLRHRHDLGLSREQVHDLEELRDGYQREAIRYDADARIAEMELQSLLKSEPVDLEHVRVKLQDIERLKVELRLARLRAIEQGKALLSLEQRDKLSVLLGEPMVDLDADRG
jgi:hypothetical protein